VSLVDLFVYAMNRIRRFFVKDEPVRYISLGEPIRRPGEPGEDLIELRVVAPTKAQIYVGKNIFLELLKFWCSPFTENPHNLPTPDRVKRLEELARCDDSVRLKQYVVTVGSLNAAVYLGLEHFARSEPSFMLNFTEKERNNLWELSDLISGNMASVSHMPMPELRVVHDYTLKWRKKLLVSEKRDF